MDPRDVTKRVAENAPRPKRTIAGRLSYLERMQLVTSKYVVLQLDLSTGILATLSVHFASLTYVTSPPIF